MTMHDESDPGPFNRIVSEIDRLTVEPGRHLSIQMDEYALAMVRAATISGQAASVTIKIVAKRKGEQVEISGTVTAKLPKPASSTVMLYPDEAGELFNYNPNHVASALPGVDVKTPRSKTRPALETPINAKKE